MQVDTDKVQTGQTLDTTMFVNGQQKNPAGNAVYIGPEISKQVIEKVAEQVAGDPTAVKYYIGVNRTKENLMQAIVTDELKTVGIRIQRDEFKINKGTWVVENNRYVLKNPIDVTSQYINTMQLTDIGFNINFGDISPEEGYQIVYIGRTDQIPEDKQVFVNDATLLTDGNDPVKYTRNFVYNASKGWGDGYNYELVLTKTDENGEVLSGAKFEIVRDKDGKLMGTIESGLDGKASIKGLFKTDYTITEIEAPQGYEIGSPIQIKATDFVRNGNVTEILNKTVINTKKPIEDTPVPPVPPKTDEPKEETPLPPVPPKTDKPKEDILVPTKPRHNNPSTGDVGVASQITIGISAAALFVVLGKKKNR